MNSFQPLGVASWAWRGVVALSLRPLIWLPFLLVGLVQAGALLLLVCFYHPALLPIGLPVVRLLGGENATHYPVLYYLLPRMFFRANLLISAFVASIAGGAATVLFSRGFGFGGEQKPWGRALRCAPALIATTLVAMGLLVGVAGLGTLVPERLTQQSFAFRWGVRGAMMLLFVLVQSVLAYTTAWIVLMGHGIWPSIRDSVRVAFRTFLPTVIIVGVPALLLFPFSFASSRVDLVAGKLRPEIIAGLLGLEVFWQILVTFLLVGAVTRLFLWRVEATR